MNEKGIMWTKISVQIIGVEYGLEVIFKNLKNFIKDKSKKKDKDNLFYNKKDLISQNLDKN